MLAGDCVGELVRGSAAAAGGGFRQEKGRCRVGTAAVQRRKRCCEEGVLKPLNYGRESRNRTGS